MKRIPSRSTVRVSEAAVCLIMSAIMYRKSRRHVITELPNQMRLDLVKTL